MEEITVTDLNALPERVLIDVREDDEYAAGHVEGAVHIPLGTLTERVGEIPTDSTVYVICALGGRSARATKFLEQSGVKAVNVAGGTMGWIDAGLPVTPPVAD